MTRFENAEAMRQAALDHIIKNPGATTPEILSALKWKTTDADRLTNMFDAGELSRVKVSHGKIRTYEYTALVKKTKSAASITKRIYGNLKGARRPKPLEPEIHFRCPKRKPIPNQGGQGAVRHEIRRGCSLS